MMSLRVTTFALVPLALAPFALATLALGACVNVDNNDLGDDCVESADCGRAELVCVLVDIRVPAGDRICLPMHDVDEPLACTSNAECPAAAYPVDATCEDGTCACVGDTFDCGPDGLVLDAPTCQCIPP
jgi:hypothetical protein